MIKCTVEHHHSAYIVKFEDGKSILLQSDTDQAAFAVHCGAITEPDNWDGTPSELGESWDNFYGLEDITRCPDEYYQVAQIFPGE